MRVVREGVSFEEEILPSYERENAGWPGYEAGLPYLHEANRRCQGRWALVLLSATDVARVMLPRHTHPPKHPIDVVPQGGLSVSAAAERLRQLPKQQIRECWEDRIVPQKDRDFSQMCICLESVNGILKHVDGLHRLLAYALFEKRQEVPAFVAGELVSSKACTAVGLGTTEEQESAEGNKWERYTGVIVHDLRRSAIRNMVAAGNPENWCMAISGHKTASTFRRYAIVSTADITTAMQRVESATLRNAEAISVKTVKKPPRTTRKLLRARSSNG